jgi:hypothetical protein
MSHWREKTNYIQNRRNADRLKRESENHERQFVLINRIANALETAKEQDQADDNKRASREKLSLGLLIFTVIFAGFAALEAYRLATDTEDAIQHADNAARTQHADTVAALSKADEANRGAKEFADRQIAEMADANANTTILADAALRQAGVAEKQILALRGNLRQETINIQEIRENVQNPGDQTESKLTGWLFNPRWTNVGGTDIRRLINWWVLTVVHRASPLTVPEQLSQPCPPIIKTDGPITSVVLPPGGGETQTAQKLSIEDARLATGESSSVSIYAVGHAEYDDIFPDTPRHHFDWCILVYPNNPEKSLFSPLDVSRDAG